MSLRNPETELTAPADPALPGGPIVTQHLPFPYLKLAFARLEDGREDGLPTGELELCYHVRRLVRSRLSMPDVWRHLPVMAPDVPFRCPGCGEMHKPTIR